MIGDWIEIPELRINGKVQEITLTTVIVWNRDHSLGTVPSVYLLSHSFKNWRGATEAGAREISWPVYFDINSIKQVDDDLVQKLSRLPLSAEILRPSSFADGPSRTPLADQFGGTNLGLLREYLACYLRNSPLIASQKLFSVHVDAPTNFGIPLQILVSTNESDYTRFLAIQSDVLEDILRLASVFDLKVYQSMASSSGGIIK
jgi:miniconductance mechanosensitive channel